MIKKALVALAGRCGWLLISKAELRELIVLCNRRGLTLVGDEELDRLCAEIAADVDRELEALMDGR
ncbi:hypothetical protein AWC11_17035 [Mycobacterium interjectum]|nr:hypothetical protein AWC11_17035 [Mycobacterium interjectum]